MATYKELGNDTITTLEDAPLMSVGSPCPTVYATEWDVSLSYYLEKGDGLGDWALFRFEQVVAHYLGPPDEEVLEKHPLTNRGLFRFGAFQVFNSSWIIQLQSLTKDSDYHQELFGKSNHYIIAFHDSIFECAAKSYSVSTGHGTVSDAFRS